MFIGHFAVAFLLWKLFPEVPASLALIAVSFPDFLWSILVPAGLEKVKVDPESPLQKNVGFVRYPYSHSLVLTNLFSAVGGLVAAVILNDILAIPVFVIGSASHWLLDTTVHLRDLPVLGFSRDTKVGLGLWRSGPLAFAVEFLVYSSFSFVFLSGNQVFAALVIGGIFHLINANSFFGFTKKNSVKTSNAYAGLALFGFTAVTILTAFLVKP